MRRYLALIALACLTFCAGKTRREYPDNGAFQYLDMTAGKPDGNVDTTGVIMYYKGKFTDTVEDLGIVEGKVSGRGKKKADVLQELQKEALKLNAEGVYQVEYNIDGETLKADGYAFRLKQ